MSTTKYGIGFLSTAPMRSEPSDRSEMVNQLLFGETFDILERQAKWSLIKLHHDNYEGWVDNLQIQNISDSYLNQIKENGKHIAAEMVHLLEGTHPSDFPMIVQGSLLPLYDDQKVILDTKEYKYSGNTRTGSGQRSDLIDVAFSYLNAPYLWGGRSPFGIDCSGFTQMVYRLIGVSIPRDASQQAKKGETLSFLEECQPGDLAFFDNAEGAITHVGIVLEDYNIIHASGRVRVDGLDHSGIYNAELKRHTHKLRVLKRLI